MSTPTLTGVYTCTHHNDQQRAACPVCLVTTLTAERDQLLRDYEYDHKCLHEVRERCESWKQRAERAEAESDALSKVKAHLFNALEHYQNCVIAGGKNPARDAIDAAMKEDAK